MRPYYGFVCRCYYCNAYVHAVVIIASITADAAAATIAANNNDVGDRDSTEEGNDTDADADAIL